MSEPRRFPSREGISTWAVTGSIRVARLCFAGVGGSRVAVFGDRPRALQRNLQQNCHLMLIEADDEDDHETIKDRIRGTQNQLFRRYFASWRDYLERILGKLEPRPKC